MLLCTSHEIDLLKPLFMRRNLDQLSLIESLLRSIRLGKVQKD